MQRLDRSSISDSAFDIEFSQMLHSTLAQYCVEPKQQSLLIHLRMWIEREMHLLQRVRDNIPEAGLEKDRHKFARCCYRAVRRVMIRELRYR